MIQTWALLLDAYRELNAKRLFWFVLALTALVVLAFACVGLNQRGVQVLWWTFDSAVINTSYVPASMFYKLMFDALGIKFWLTWAATILALVSTAAIIPDFIASGAIELTLSKPIGRLRLLYTKFATGLLFVGLQVSVFTVACFFILGIRGESWEPAIFLAIPLVLLFFSYLFSICLLAGLITRSTIASLLLTLLAWVFFWACGTADQITLVGLSENGNRIQMLERKIRKQESNTRKLLRDQATKEGKEPPRVEDMTPEMLDNNNPALVGTRTELSDLRKSRETWEYSQKLVLGVKAFVPKTAETIDLLQRVLVTTTELQSKVSNASDEADEDTEEPADDRRRRRRGGGIFDNAEPDEIQMELRKRSLWWVLGTSLAFEGMVLGIAGVIFVRRDF